MSFMMLSHTLQKIFDNMQHKIAENECAKN